MSKKELANFFSTQEKISSFIGEISADNHLSINIYFATNDYVIHELECGTKYYDKERIIHSISKKMKDKYIENICLDNLLEEYKLYSDNNFEINDNEITFQEKKILTSPMFTPKTIKDVLELI